MEANTHTKLDTIRQHKVAIIFTILGILLAAFSIWLIFDAIDTRRVDAEAVTLKDTLIIEFNQPVKASDFIANLNGEYITDPEIDTTQLGRAIVRFEYFNLKHKKRHLDFDIEVIDTTAPIIYGQNAYSVPVGYEGDLVNLMLSGDNIDDHPTRTIIGEYDVNRAGAYPLQYAITDSSGNQALHNFVLNVISPNSSPSTSATEITRLPIANIIRDYKTDQTRVGIDVSSWQGEINWQEVRDAGVEFAFIRLGYQVDFGSEYKLDPKFEDNIRGALHVGLPVGVYFYSCADSVGEAKRQAEWILRQVGNYKLELGIAFDWEEWSDFNRANMSFYTLEKTANTFLETVEAAGYNGLLYGSKNYLTRFWQNNTYAVWLAQYYHRPTYEKPFQFWQLSDSGVVPGINGPVDLDIWYYADSK